MHSQNGTGCFKSLPSQADLGWVCRQQDLCSTSSIRILDAQYKAAKFNLAAGDVTLREKTLFWDEAITTFSTLPQNIDNVKVRMLEGAESCDGSLAEHRSLSEYCITSYCFGSSVLSILHNHELESRIDQIWVRET